MEKALEGLKGVESFEVKFLGKERGVVRFRFRANETNVKTLVSSVESVNEAFDVTVGDPKDVPVPDEDIDFRIISAGGRYDIQKSLAKDKATVFFFQGKGGWKATMLGLRLEALVKKKPFAIRKIYLTGNAARKQFASDFGKKALPYLRLYNSNGQYVGEAWTVAELKPLLK